MPTTPALTFGALLKQLRKRAGMTQRALAAALGYSDSLISSLEKGQRQPDLAMVIQRFVPALGLQDDPSLASQLITGAAAARGERVPVQHTHLSLRQAAQRLAPPAERFHLPALPVEVIGRDEAVNQIGNRLLGHGGRLLTLVGPPGVGKTTLALAVAERVQYLYTDGAYFLPLAPVIDSHLMAEAILFQLAAGDASPKPPLDRLVEILRRTTTLLVLDNLEQIDGAPALIATLLVECPGVTVLATSRERLHLRAEQRFLVSSLKASDAVELFVRRAQAVNPDFAVSREDEPTVQHICGRLGYLPLAIELSAAWVHVFTCAEIADEIEHNLHFLTTSLRDIPERHRSLYAVYDHSWRLLSLAEQMAFARLAVFRGRFTQEASELVAEVALPTLSSLVDKSLLYRTATGDFEMHECSRQFAADKLGESGGSLAIQQRHEAYFDLQTQKILQQMRSAILPLPDPVTDAQDMSNLPVAANASILGHRTGMHILMLSWEYPPYVTGGSGKHVDELVSALSQSTFPVGPVNIDLYTPRFAGGQVEELIGSRLIVRRLELPPDLRYPFSSTIPDQALLTEQILRLAQNRTYDLIHIQSWRFATIATVLKRQQNAPLIATFHLLERMRHPQTLPDEIGRIENLEREVAQAATHIIVCSQYMRHELQNQFNISHEKIDVIPNGVSVKSGDYFPSEQQNSLRQRHAPLGQNLLLFIGSALIEKGLSLLIRAMPHILADHPETRLVVAGKDCDRLLPLAYELNVEKAIDFVGFVSDQERDWLYQTVDALIVPSLYEPFGIVALEAMAFGCNVIVSDVGGLGEVIRNTENGLSIRPNDPQCIAHATHLLFTDPAAALQRRAQALEDIRTLYQWPKIAAQTAQIYHSLVSAAPQ